MGLMDWLLGKKKQTVPAEGKPPSPLASTLSPAERAEIIQQHTKNQSTSQAGLAGAATGLGDSAPGIRFEVRLECRPMTAEELAEERRRYKEAFDWVLQTETLEISDEDRKKLFDFLLAKWNSSRIGKAELEALHIQLSWPRGEAHIAQKKQAALQDACEEIDGWTLGEMLLKLKAVELKELVAQYNLTIKGRATKAVMSEALLRLNNDTLEELRQDISNELKRRRAQKAIVTLQELVEMFHLRVMRAKWRVLNAEYIIDQLSSEWKPPENIKVSLYGGGSDIAPCGLQNGEIRPANELLARAQQPACEALECLCSFRAYSVEQQKRLAAIRAKRENDE